MNTEKEEKVEKLNFSQEELMHDIYLIKKIQKKYNKDIECVFEELLEELDNVLLQVIHDEMDEKIIKSFDE